MEWRHRERSQYQPNKAADVYQLGGDCSNTSWLNIGTRATCRTGWEESMFDQVVEGFHKRRLRGEVFFNPMVSTKRESSSGGGNGAHIRSVANSCSSPVLKHEHRVDGDGFASLICAGSTLGVGTARALSDSDVDRLEVETSTRCLSDRGRFGGGNLSESIAEYRQSLDSLHDLGKGLNSLLSGSVFRRAKGVSDLYLLYRYGIKPMLSDIQGVIEGLEEVVMERRETTRARGSIQATTTQTFQKFHDNIRTDYRFVVTDTAIVRAMSLDEVVRTRLNNVGINLKGILSLPWELTTLSFVADWAVNFGDFIGAMLPNLGYNQLGSCLVTERKVQHNWVSLGSFEAGTGYTVQRPVTGSLLATQVDKIRGPLRAPRLTIKSDFRMTVATRVGDAFALVGSRLLGKTGQLR